MSIEVDFIGPNDKPALLGISTAEYLAPALAGVSELGYKVHTAETHQEFLSRFVQFQYQVVIIEDCFACATQEENAALKSIQTMSMNRRRHAMFMLVGAGYQTFNVMQAYQQSVHAVVNPAELTGLSTLIQKVVMDNELFLNCYRETMTRIAQGKA